MNASQVVALLLILFQVVLSKHPEILDTSSAFHSRQKRYLIWHEGINWVQMIVGIGVPFEVNHNSVTIGAVIKSFYTLPTNSSEYTNPGFFVRRRREATRWIVYEMIEKFFERYNYGDGKACLLRSICETSSKGFDEKSGLLAEVIHALLTPSSSADPLQGQSNTLYHAAEKLGKEVDNCAVLFPECNDSFIRQFSKFFDRK